MIPATHRRTRALVAAVAVSAMLLGAAAPASAVPKDRGPDKGGNTTTVTIQGFSWL
ncbi:MAG: hypothetical protein WD010_06885 [Nitriliruptor sp.]|uniref:hypothetical protein n=1 Tax=Nitriliruptor sp. TaxID=2448056 RepID=UPI0034A04B31